MNAREFLKVYKYDERLITGDYYPQEPVRVEPGDRVGVVMMNLGGPMAEEDVEPFLYNLFMDPAIIDIPLPKGPRHWLSKFIASKRSKSVGEDYKLIGGNSPINRLTREQAEALEKRLNAASVPPPARRSAPTSPCGSGSRSARTALGRCRRTASTKWSSSRSTPSIPRPRRARRSSTGRRSKRPARSPRGRRRSSSSTPPTRSTCRPSRNGSTRGCSGSRAPSATRSTCCSPRMARPSRR